MAPVITKWFFKMDGFVFKSAREKQKLTLLDVYAELDITPSTINGIENNKSKNPSFETIRRLCKFFKLDINLI